MAPLCLGKRPDTRGQTGGGRGEGSEKCKGPCFTEPAIAARGLKLAGWITNRIDPAMSRFEENLAALRARIDAPLLGVIPAASTPEAAAALLRIP